MRSEYVIPAPVVPSLAVRGSDRRFPIHRIYCVGRNYAAHAVEMGHDPSREPPFFFQKNPDTLLPSGGNFPYPDKSEDVHYELELVIALTSGGKNIAEADTLEQVFGYAVGLDMTRRDLQGQAKKMVRPWDVGKAFDHSAPCTEIVPADAIGHPDAGAVWLKVNGERRQVRRKLRGFLRVASEHRFEHRPQTPGELQQRELRTADLPRGLPGP